MPKSLRIALAVVAGFIALNLVSAVLSALTLAFTHPRSALDPPFMVLNVLSGLLAATAGGYVAALVAGGAELIAGACLAGILFIFGIRSFLVYSGKVPAWYAFVLAFVSPVVVFAAASLTARYTQRRLL